MNEAQNSTVTDILTLVDDAARLIRSSLGIANGGALRVAYLPGPGDVLGTYHYWREKVQDPRVPVVSYSWMFYELMYRVGAQVEVISPAVKTSSPGETEPWIRFVHVDRAAAQGALGYYRSERAYTDEICRQLDRFEPHVVLTSTDLASGNWQRLRRKCGKLILTAHNSFWPMGRKPTGLKEQIKQALLRYNCRAIDGAVCTSAECMRQIHEVTDGRVNGLVQVPQLLRDYPLEERKSLRNLLFLGRIEENKGIFMLLDAFLALKPRFPDLTLTFAGAGGGQSALEGRVARAGYPDVRLTGKLDAAGVHQQIAMSDLVVCPTTTRFNEGLAMVGVEAAAHGVPTLLSSVVPVSDLLGESCIVFEADDEPALHDALERLIVDDSAYQKLLPLVRARRDIFYDKSQSWGSQLGRVLLSL